MDIDSLLRKGNKIKSSYLKDLLFKYGLKQNKCEVCGISEWQGNSINCQLHHIDGDNTNNCIENLQILCPNCHSQTDSYCSGWKKQHTKTFCLSCGKEISKNATYCIKCFHKKERRIFLQDFTISKLTKEDLPRNL